jgi:hypothetical protein
VEARVRPLETSLTAIAAAAVFGSSIFEAKSFDVRQVGNEKVAPETLTCDESLGRIRHHISPAMGDSARSLH